MLELVGAAASRGAQEGELLKALLIGATKERPKLAPAAERNVPEEVEDSAKMEESRG